VLLKVMEVQFDPKVSGRAGAPLFHLGEVLGGIWAQGRLAGKTDRVAC
jgi:hypothetical protein